MENRIKTSIRIAEKLKKIVNSRVFFATINLFRLHVSDKFLKCFIWRWYYISLRCDTYGVTLYFIHKREKRERGKLENPEKHSREGR